MKTTFIYELIDPRTNETKYIGKTNNPQNRLRKHINESERGVISYKNNWIKGLLESGLKPIFNVIDEVLLEEWSFWERFYISLYKSWNLKLTNLTEGGDTGPCLKGKKNGMYGRKHTSETKLKIGLINKGNKYNLGKHLSKKTKLKIGLANKGNKYNLGRITSEETKNKISLANKGKIKSKKTIKKWKKSVFEYWNNSEHREEVSKRNLATKNGNYKGVILQYSKKWRVYKTMGRIT
jgi:hypothetical protein